jgi:hypothetical protein
VGFLGVSNNAYILWRSNMNKKETKQLEELIAVATGSGHLTSEEINLWNELEFKRNKENIHFTLSGINKYYKAFQCWDFTQYILKNGYKRYKPSDIEEVYFDNNSITIKLVSTAVSDIERFNNKNELLSYVIGFNACLSEVA